MIHSSVEKLAIAPMIDWTDTFFRRLMRILAPNALLYTEMQTTGAVFNNPERALQFSKFEKPLALQLGGSDPDALARCAQIAEEMGFDEINLNLGCPSFRVQAGRFGACLMAEPALVAKCIEKMKSVTRIPITAKTRIGIDKEDSYDFFSFFVKHLINAGVDKLIVHARKAWLKGLNPKQNRTIPPLHYNFVYQIKKEIGRIPVIINGNITEVQEIQTHLAHVDGVMIGRLACQNPYGIATIHQALYPKSSLPGRSSVLSQYLQNVSDALTKGGSVNAFLKPLYGLAHGLPGAKIWKEKLMSIQRTRNLHELDEVFSVLRLLEANTSSLGLSIPED